MAEYDTRPQPQRSPVSEGALLRLAVAAHDDGVSTILEGDDGGELAAVVPMTVLDDLARAKRELTAARIRTSARAAVTSGAAEATEVYSQPEAMAMLGRDALGRRTQAA